MQNKNFIIGGGISGLLYAYKNPNYIIIESDEVGGKLKKKFFENIIYLHHTIETEELLLELNIKFTKRTQLIKYYKEGKVTQDITKEDKIRLIRKKMSDETFNPTDLNLSTSDYYIKILEFNFQDLINKIREKVIIKKDKVIRITDKEIITENTSYQYDNIVSTIPAYIFWTIYYKQNSLKFDSKPITFVLCNKEPEEFKSNIYDMIYVIDNDKKYARVSKKPNTRDKNLLLYEFTGKISKEEVKKYLPKNSKILEYYIDDNGIIFTNKNNISPKNILFVGRFATYVHSDKQQNVLQEANWNYDLRHIFNRQAFFQKNFFDFNNLNNIEYKEKLTKDTILHLLAELGEVLNEINYKYHKKQKEVDESKLKIELIDLQKYLLNLFLIWNIDAKEFVKMYNEKSDFVEKRYENEFKK